MVCALIFKTPRCSAPKLHKMSTYRCETWSDQCHWSFGVCNSHVVSRIQSRKIVVVSKTNFRELWINAVSSSPQGDMFSSPHQDWSALFWLSLKNSRSTFHWHDLWQSQPRSEPTHTHSEHHLSQNVALHCEDWLDPTTDKSYPARVAHQLASSTTQVCALPCTPCSCGSITFLDSSTSTIAQQEAAPCNLEVRNSYVCTHTSQAGAAKFSKESDFTFTHICVSHSPSHCRSTSQQLVQNSSAPFLQLFWHDHKPKIENTSRATQAEQKAMHPRDKFVENLLRRLFGR